MYAMLFNEYFGKLYRSLKIVLSCVLICSDLVDAQINCSDGAKGPSVAHDMDDAESFFALALQFSEEGTSEQAFHAYLKAAEMGHAEAQLRVSWYYYHGFNVRQDYDRFEFWCQCAAEQGLPEAQVKLAEFYEVKARVWLYPQLIAAHGASHAEEMFGQYARKAFYWMEQAANQGHPWALYFMGKYYEEGMGVSPDKQLALYWYRLAAEQNTSRELYLKGQECENQNRMDEALEWYRKAAFPADLCYWCDGRIEP